MIQSHTCRAPYGKHFFKAATLIERPPESNSSQVAFLPGRVTDSRRRKRRRLRRRTDGTRLPARGAQATKSFHFRVTVHIGRYSRVMAETVVVPLTSCVTTSKGWPFEGGGRSPGTLRTSPSLASTRIPGSGPARRGGCVLGAGRRRKAASDRALMQAGPPIS